MRGKIILGRAGIRTRGSNSSVVLCRPPPHSFILNLAWEDFQGHLVRRQKRINQLSPLFDLSLYASQLLIMSTSPLTSSSTSFNVVSSVGFDIVVVPVVLVAVVVVVVVVVVVDVVCISFRSRCRLFPVWGPKDRERGIFVRNSDFRFVQIVRNKIEYKIKPFKCSLAPWANACLDHYVQPVRYERASVYGKSMAMNIIIFIMN